MTTDNLPHLHIASPEDLLGAVPYLLGHHRCENLVAVGLDATGVTVTAAVDLDDLWYPATVSDLFGLVAKAGADAVVALIYTDQLDGTVLLALPLTPAAERAGVELIDTQIADATTMRVTHSFKNNLLAAVPAGSAHWLSVSAAGRRL